MTCFQNSVRLGSLGIWEKSGLVKFCAALRIALFNSATNVCSKSRSKRAPEVSNV